MIPIRDTAPCHTKPYITWALILICILIFLRMQFMSYEEGYWFIYRYGMVPNRYANPLWGMLNGLPFDYFRSFVTNLFLHAGWMHLLFNLWFMWIFADNVEDRMGHGRFLVFYLVCGVLATGMQWYFAPTLIIPVLGASGAIAGVLAAYYFLFPYERVVVYFFPIVVHIPAIAFLGLWVIFQLYHITTSTYVEGMTMDSAWWAHLGGFIAGSVLFRFFLRKEETV